MKTTKTAAKPPVAFPVPKLNMRRTSESFTAEYSILLVGLSILIGCLQWILFGLGNLLAAAVSRTPLSYGGDPLHVGLLWGGIMALTVSPVVYVLWQRVSGELAVNKATNGELPKGAAHGFRTLWLVLAGVSAICMVAAAFFVPMAASLTGDASAPQLVLRVTLPALLSAVVICLGAFVLTRRTPQQKVARNIVLGLAGATLLLAVGSYVWAYYAPKEEAPKYEPYYNIDPYTGSGADPYTIE